ncbi:MAG TPA: hypothetical protein VFD58_19860 [Blastocatellia bacterium]|nr:hypothetical protein [Blastocatellia bacterium]
MKKTAGISSLLALLLILGAAGHSRQNDIPGWQDARWGMSEDDLVKVSGPRLRKLPKKEIFYKSHVDYVIPEYELEGRIYTVFFQMNDVTNRLSQVLIRSNEMKSRVPRVEVFNSLAARLAREFGSSGKHKDKSQLESPAKFMVIDLSRTWKFPTTTVELSYDWDNQIYASLLTIRYFPTK